MAKKYNLKLSGTIQKVIEIYKEFEPLKRGDTVSAYLKPVIHKEVNRMLDELNSERETNKALREFLKKEEYKDILVLLETNKRF